MHHYYCLLCTIVSTLPSNRSIYILVPFPIPDSVFLVHIFHFKYYTIFLMFLEKLLHFTFRSYTFIMKFMVSLCIKTLKTMKSKSHLTKNKVKSKHVRFFCLKSIYLLRKINIIGIIGKTSSMSSVQPLARRALYLFRMVSRTNILNTLSIFPRKLVFLYAEYHGGFLNRPLCYLSLNSIFIVGYRLQNFFFLFSLVLSLNYISLMHHNTKNKYEYVIHFIRSLASLNKLKFRILSRFIIGRTSSGYYNPLLITRHFNISPRNKSSSTRVFPQGNFHRHRSFFASFNILLNHRQHVITSSSFTSSPFTFSTRGMHSLLHSNSIVSATAYSSLFSLSKRFYPGPNGSTPKTIALTKPRNIPINNHPNIHHNSSYNAGQRSIFKYRETPTVNERSPMNHHMHNKNNNFYQPNPPSLQERFNNNYNYGFFGRSWNSAPQAPTSDILYTNNPYDINSNTPKMLMITDGKEKQKAALAKIEASQILPSDHSTMYADYNGISHSAPIAIPQPPTLPAIKSVFNKWKNYQPLSKEEKDNLKTPLKSVSTNLPYTTVITNETDANDFTDEMMAQELLKRGLAKKDDGSTVASIIDRNNNEYQLGTPDHNIKLTAAGQSYNKEAPSKIPLLPLVSEELPININEPIIGFSINETTFMKTGEQKHLLIVEPIKNGYASFAYLTNKSTAKILASKLYRTHQVEMEDAINHTHTKIPDNWKKPQKAVPFDNIRIFSKEQFERVKWDNPYIKNYIDIITLKTIWNESITKPQVKYNENGITKQRGLEICQAYDFIFYKKYPHPVTYDQELANEKNKKNKKSSEQPNNDNKNHESEKE